MANNGNMRGLLILGALFYLTHGSLQGPLGNNMWIASGQLVSGGPWSGPPPVAGAVPATQQNLVAAGLI